MTVTANFIFISASVREVNGKTYHNVNIESDDGEIFNLGSDPEVIGRLQKYQKYTGFFNVRVFDRNMYMRLTDVKPVDKPSAGTK